MYRVLIEHSDNRGIGKHLDLVMKTEKLYELIGRYTMKHGAPEEIYNEAGIMELDFYQQIKGGYIQATISFAKISEDKKSGKIMKSSTIPITKNVQPYKAPPVVDEKPDERIQSMLDAGVLNKW